MFEGNFGLMLAAMFLAFVATEGVVEYLAGELIERFAPGYKWAQKYISALVGVGFAFFYKMDLAILVGLPFSVVGQIVTGIMLGRGANFISDLFGLIAAWTKNLREEF